jgi:hypothetical protein
VHQENVVARAGWTGVAPVHRRVVRNLLEQAGGPDPGWSRAADAPPAPTARVSPKPTELLALARPWTEDPKKEIRMSSPLKRLTRKVFERHSNPWSAWTRLLSVPLVFVPFWIRSPKYALLVGGWMLLNPVVFPRPEVDSAWATKAMLGEELWIAERPLDGAMAINVVAATFGIGGVVASLKRKLAPTALSMVAEITLLLVYWRLMVDFYEEHRSDRG